MTNTTTGTRFGAMVRDIQHEQGCDKREARKIAYQIVDHHMQNNPNLETAEAVNEVCNMLGIK